MNSRANKPDTQADIELRECIEAVPPRSFSVVAGAGSGKTTSLIKGLEAILSVHGERLRLRRQKVACITYTEVAAGEIWADIGNNPLVHVSTIHSFLWTISRGLQQDVRDWVAHRIEERIAKLNDEAENFSQRVKAKKRRSTARDIARFGQYRDALGQVPTFTYAKGGNYAKGVLGHDDIINLAVWLITERPLFRTLLAQQFPFVFVDESQDTFPKIVNALLAVEEQEGDRFCLGFFGDPMQRIFPTGIGKIPAPEGWKQITKPENFRAPASVLTLANAIRSGDDGLSQIGGRTVEIDGEKVTVPGTARMFVLPANGSRDAYVAQVRNWIAGANGDQQWESGAKPDTIKMLVIAHRMAAKRLGFGNLYAALNDKSPESFKEGLLDASAWPLQPFMNCLLPLAEAVANGEGFEVMRLLRKHSPQLAQDGLGNADVARSLGDLQLLSDRLADMMSLSSDATLRDVLKLAGNELIELDPRLAAYLGEQTKEAGGELEVAEPENFGAEIAEADEADERVAIEASAMAAFLACPANQLRPYRIYVEELSPFSTQQGVKGAEFDRVLTILDDEEGTHPLFSYERYLGIAELSPTDLKNRLEDRETVVERTRRLFYVCCTRARQDLVLILFVADPASAISQIRTLGLLPDTDIHSLADLA